MGASTIARQFKVRHPTIYRILRLAGVETRSAADSHKGKACKPVTRRPVGDAPECACNCGGLVEWNQRKDRWNRYVIGHYTQRGEQSHTWQDGRSYEPYAPDWRYISRQIRQRDGYRCQECGECKRRLHVHHIDTDKLNNAPTNLVTLCNCCHGKAHAALRGGGA